MAQRRSSATTRSASRWAPYSDRCRESKPPSTTRVCRKTARPSPAAQSGRLGAGRREGTQRRLPFPNLTLRPPQAPGRLRGAAARSPNRGSPRPSVRQGGSASYPSCSVGRSDSLLAPAARIAACSNDSRTWPLPVSPRPCVRDPPMSPSHPSWRGAAPRASLDHVPRRRLSPIASSAARELDSPFWPSQC